MDKAKYLADHCFNNRGWDNIDMEYVFALITEYDAYKKSVEEHVNKYTTSFTFDQMDLIDQSVFILGYIEYVKLDTPKEVLLNEMIELSKRYGDDGAGKLINGIMHHVIKDLDSAAKKEEEVEEKVEKQKEMQETVEKEEVEITIEESED
jgi:N utilization substance protein B